MSRRDEMPTPERLNSRGARYYYRCVTSGICPQCGRPAGGLTILCEPCREKVRAYQRRRYAARKAARGK